jgi:hypothetical protein
MTPYVVTARQSRGEVPERDDWMRRSKCLLHYTALLQKGAGVSREPCFMFML